MSARRMGLPAALRSHAIGRWSACRSSTESPRSQNGCSRRAWRDSLVHAWS